jgi:hypothetical protein
MNILSKKFKLRFKLIYYENDMYHIQYAYYRIIPIWINLYESKKILGQYREHDIFSFKEASEIVKNIHCYLDIQNWLTKQKQLKFHCRTTQKIINII